MATKENSQDYQPYYNVLKKYINLLLFGSVVKPKFPPNKILPIEPSLLKMLKDVESLGDKSEENSVLKDHMDDFYLKLKSRLRHKDKIDLMQCYVESNFKTIIQATNILKRAENSKYVYEFGDDLKIFEELLSTKKKFPVEIIGYMSAQFGDLFQYLPENRSIINLHYYQGLLNKYVTKYDIDEMLNIVCNVKK